MAFIRKQIVKGNVYYQYVRSYREGKKVKVRVICSLGKHSSLQSALDEAKKMRKEERIRRLEAVITKKGGVVTKRGSVVTNGAAPEGAIKEGVVTKPERTRFPTLRQLSPRGNLTRRRRLLVERERGPAPYDLLPPPGKGEEWGKSYWTRFTLDLISRKVEGADSINSKELAKKLFPHYHRTLRMGLGQATLVYTLLKDKPDNSVKPARFIYEYLGADVKAMVSQVKRRGSQNGRAVLIEADVIQIRKEHGEGKTLKALAESFGVGVEAVFKVVHKQTWKHVGLTP